MWLTLLGHNSSLRETRARSQAGAEAEPWKNTAHWFLACSWSADFLYNSDHLLREGATHSELHQLMLQRLSCGHGPL